MPLVRFTGLCMTAASNGESLQTFRKDLLSTAALMRNQRIFNDLWNSKQLLLSVGKSSKAHSAMILAAQQNCTELHSGMHVKHPRGQTSRDTQAYYRH